MRPELKCFTLLATHLRRLCYLFPVVRCLGLNILSFEEFITYLLSLPSFSEIHKLCEAMFVFWNVLELSYLLPKL